LIGEFNGIGGIIGCLYYNCLNVTWEIIVTWQLNRITNAYFNCVIKNV